MYKKRYLFFLILAPLLIYCLLNVYILDEHNERVSIYWNIHYISIFSFLFIYFNKSFVAFYFSNKVIIFSLLSIYLLGLITSFFDPNFNIRIFIQFLIIPLILVLSLFIGYIISFDDKLLKWLIKTFKIFLLAGFLVISVELYNKGITLFLLRPYAWSFYFFIIPFFFIASNKNESYLNKIIFLVITLIICSFSGIRSAMILVVAISIKYIFTTKYNFFLFILVIFMISGLDDFLNNFNATRFVSIETSRNDIWEQVLFKIVAESNYFIGNGLVKPNFSTANEQISIAHNTFLQLFYSFGLIGVLVSFPLFFYFLKSLYNRGVFLLLGFFVISLINDLPILIYEFSRIGEGIIFFVFFGFILNNDES